MKYVSEPRTVSIVGHKNPDTDSICSAIAYAYLKNQIDPHTPEKYVACRQGEVNRETQYALEHFGLKLPKLMTDISPQIKDIDIRQQPGIDGEISIHAAYTQMIADHVDTLCVSDEHEMLCGLISIKDVTNANMNLSDKGVLAEAETPYMNLLEVLDGSIILGKADARITRGKILVGTSPEAIMEYVEEGDLVLVTNRYEAQISAVDKGADCIVICADAKVSDLVLKRAEQTGCTVIATGYDTYAAARLVSMAAPVRHFMIRDMVKFTPNTLIDEARKVMADLRHHYFPIVDESGHYLGEVSRRNMLGLRKKQVILVDHNELSQTIDGIEEAEILEIIDHHRIGTLETSGPVYFRNMPVGCTSTILLQMFRENNVDIPKPIAGAMLSAILSDTLCLRSPTCTAMDKDAIETLAKIAGEDYNEYAEAMFEAADDLTGRDADDIMFSDFKLFTFDKSNFGVGQGMFMSDNSIKKAETMIESYLPQACEKAGVPAIFYMLTSLKKNSTLLLYGGNDMKKLDEEVSKAYHVEAKDGKAELPGVVSRKKQLLPPLRGVME